MNDCVYTSYSSGTMFSGTSSFVELDTLTRKITSKRFASAIRPTFVCTLKSQGSIVTPKYIHTTTAVKVSQQPVLIAGGA